MHKTGSGENAVVLAPIAPKFLLAHEVAAALRIGISQFNDLRREHKELYAPDGTRGRGKRALPLWSAPLVELLSEVRTNIMPGVPMYTVKEAIAERRRLYYMMRERRNPTGQVQLTP